MVLNSHSLLNAKKILAGLKTLCLIAISIVTLLHVNGCMKSDEKNYSGTTQGEFPLHFELAMKFSGEEKMIYKLKVIPTHSEEFLNKLNKKWHDEARLKFSAYDKMKEYCDLNKDAALCFNFNELKKEVESKEVQIFYAIKIYDNSKNELDNIGGKFTYDLNNKQTFKETWMEVASSVKMNHTKFRNIESVELHIE